MRLALVLAVLLAGALAALQPLAAHAARRATVTTPVLAGPVSSMQAFAPDSAPTPDSLTFLETMGICGNTICDGSRPLCEGESLFVSLSGHLPSDCHRIREIAIYYPPIVSIRPFAPWVVVYVDDGACLGRPCIRQRRFWDGVIAMPPLPAGPYSLDVAVVRVSCGDSLPPPTAPTRSLPFSVAACDSTPPPADCLLGDWVHSGDVNACDATITPGGEAKVVFGVQAAVPLSGLQGEFNVHPGDLKIIAFEVTGDAYGYRFGWSPTATGARWFLFNDGGNPIPPGPPLKPVFIVTLHAAPGVPVPAESRIYSVNLLGADAAGNAVYPCPTLTDTPGSNIRFAPPSARICGTADCDANHDGLTDVRDLVLMVLCLRGGVACPSVYDCDRNNTFNLDDVMCCAWRILRVRPCPPGSTCGPDSLPPTPPHKDGTVRVTNGVPVEQDGEVRMPIRIEGADRVGAARLAMRFPAGRWRVLGVESNDAAWLTLAGEESGEAIVGAIRLGPASSPGSLDLTLRLEPIGGPASGGELGALSVDLSATDGVRIIGPVVAPARPLPGGPTVALSENRPDPFSGETRFTLSLPFGETVDVGVFDLNGRRIATLHRGALKAGVSEFAWNGRSDSGLRVGAGVYFYRAVTGATATSRRMVYLGNR